MADEYFALKMKDNIAMPVETLRKYVWWSVEMGIWNKKVLYLLFNFQNYGKERRKDNKN